MINLLPHKSTVEDLLNIRLLQNISTELQEEAIMRSPSYLSHLGHSRQKEIIAKKPKMLPFSSEEIKDDRSEVLRLIKLDGSILQHVSRLFKNDKNLVITAMKQKTTYIKYASFEAQQQILQDNPSLLGDVALVKELLKQSPTILREASYKVQLNILKESPNLLSNLSLFHQKAILAKNPAMLKFASDEIIDSPETIQDTIIKENHARLKTLDFDIQKKIIKKSLLMIEYAHATVQREVFRDNPEFARHPTLLKIFSTQNTNLLYDILKYVDYETELTILRAVLEPEEISKNPTIFPLNEDELYDKMRNIDSSKMIFSRGQPHIRRRCILNFCTQFDFGAGRPENLLSVLRCAERIVIKDKDLMLRVVERLPKALPLFDSQLKSDKDTILEVVTRVPNAVAFINSQLKDDKDVILAAVSQKADMLKEASDRLKADPEIVLAVARKSITALTYAKGVFKNNTKNDLILAFRSNPQLLSRLSGGLFNNLNKQNITSTQALLLESIFVKHLCRVTNLYVNIRVLVRSKILEPYMNNIAGFLFYNYDSSITNIVTNAVHFQNNSTTLAITAISDNPNKQEGEHKHHPG